MKKIFVLMASAAVLFAACNKMEEVNTPVDTPVGTEVITVVLNPVTKTSLDGKATLWTAGDKVSVKADGVDLGNLELVKGSSFSGTLNSATLDGATEVTLHYPAGVDTVPAEQTAVAGSFANGAALLDGTSTMAALRAGEGATLSNTTALLTFSVAQAGDVTFEVGTAKYTVTGCEIEKTYYACVAPAASVDFVARIGGYLSNKASNKATFKANQVANLGELPAPVKSSWGVIGLNGDWNNDIAMYDDLNGYSVAKNVTIKSTDEFKFRVGEWENEVSGGLTAPDTKRTNNTTIKANITTSKAGTYDVYTNGTEYYIMTPGRMPSTASAPSDITITISSIDKNYKCLHMWGAVSVNCKYSSNSTWSVTIPADKLDERVKAILTKGASDGKWNWQTNDSDDLCLRNPMPLKVVDNKATH